MKNFLTIVLLVGLFISAVSAEGAKLFDLKEQYFSGTLIKKGKKGYGEEQKYNLPKVIVTTDSKFIKGKYMYGLFTVDVKNPVKDWNVNIKKKNGTDDRDTTTIRLTSDNGNSYFISFNDTYGDKKDYIQINNKNFKIGYLQKLNITVSVSKKNNTVKFYINGKAFLKIDAKDFGNLAKVEIELNQNKYNDELLALDIYEVK